MLKPGEYIMTQKDLRRLHLIKKVSEKRLLQREAAALLNLSERQIRRILIRYNNEGDFSIVHKSKGKMSQRKRSLSSKRRIISLYKKNYYDFGPTLASEKLFELNQIKISNESLRQLLIERGLWERKRSRKKHRKYRERKAHFGELIQMDGSHHDWLEGRGPKLVLMSYIDDATGKAYGRFYEYEGTIPAMDSFRRYISKNGLPQCIYFDQHSTYKNNNAKPTIEDELNDTVASSQFGRALKEIGVKYIHANSPQAKGRVERLFKTLQDRLIKEMRLANICTMKEANSFLEKYWKKHNQKFSISPRKQTDLHRKLYPVSAIERALSKRTKRPLRNDLTIVHNKKWYQILKHTSAKTITVEDRYDGKMFITYKEKPLKFKPINKPEKQQELLIKGRFKTSAHKPANDNFFKLTNWSLISYKQNKKEWEENYVNTLVQGF